MKKRTRYKPSVEELLNDPHIPLESWKKHGRGVVRVTRLMHKIFGQPDVGQLLGLTPKK